MPNAKFTSAFLGLLQFAGEMALTDELVTIKNEGLLVSKQHVFVGLVSSQFCSTLSGTKQKV